MSTQAHTPGPWRTHLGVVVADLPDGEFKTRAVAYVGDEFRHSAGLQYGQERDANARLIAAAPDLLAAAKEAYEHAALHTADCERVTTYEEGAIFEDATGYTCFLSRLRAAIVKAEPRQRIER